MAEFAKRMIQKAGVQIVGGCCGTSPAHIKAIRGAVRALQPGKRISVSRSAQQIKEQAMEPMPTAKKSAFARKLQRKFCVSVEMYPPRGADASKVLRSAEMLKEYGVDTVNIPDGPRAMARMSPMAIAHLIESKLGLETILHYACRDRNILGMQSDILGAHVLELRNILSITGDPPKLGDYPDATSVFDLDSIGLTRMLQNLNCGEDLVNNPIGAQTNFHVGVGANPGALNLENELDRFAQKVEAGAEFAMTQPIFDVDLLTNFLDKTKESRIPVMVGILPLISSRNAEFLHNEVPGMTIPKAIRDKMATVTDKKAKALGIAIAQEAVEQARELEGVAGVYIMPPFGRVKLALDVMKMS
jgi:5,10-methylenetetrahydrofolate reductase